MVAVAPDKRGQGIGRELIKRLVGDDSGLTWVLRAGRDSKGFWQKIGFKVLERLPLAARRRSRHRINHFLDRQPIREIRRRREACVSHTGKEGIG